jgi:tripartite-type tricarboxylate transporter receptor subunit TctC
VTYWRDALKKMTETAAWKKELETHQWVASFEDEKTFTESLAMETKIYTDLLSRLNLVKAK